MLLLHVWLHDSSALLLPADLWLLLTALQESLTRLTLASPQLQRQLLTQAASEAQLVPLLCQALTALLSSATKATNFGQVGRCVWSRQTIPTLPYRPLLLLCTSCFAARFLAL
jgi:hypothetical protein